MDLKLHTPPQPGPQKSLQQIIGQKAKNHTGDDQQRQGPLEVQEAGGDQESNVRCRRSHWWVQQGKTMTLNPERGLSLSSSQPSCPHLEVKQLSPLCQNVIRGLGTWLRGGGLSSIPEALAKCVKKAFLCYKVVAETGG